MSNYSPTSHSFYSQRLRLHYVEWGDPKAPTMVLVHGVRDHARTWDDVLAHFVDDYHIVAPDLRGHGDSEWVRGSGYDYLDYVYDLYQLIVQNDFGPVVLVGHSLGGAITSFFAGIYPELVSKLIVIEGIGMWQRDSSEVSLVEKLRNWVETTQSLADRQPKRYDSLEAAYQRMQHANPQLSSDQAYHLTLHGSVRHEDGRFTWKYDNYTYNFSIMGVRPDEMIELWQAIQCPTLLLNAQNGLDNRTGQDGTLLHFANAQLHNIADAGHWTHHDQAQAVVDSITAFLAN
jgi:pimeloyl-ACP methyl ester carboxylesterase